MFLSELSESWVPFSGFKGSRKYSTTLPITKRLKVIYIFDNGDTSETKEVTIGIDYNPENTEQLYNVFE